jgi:hypothetical protein
VTATTTGSIPPAWRAAGRPAMRWLRQPRLRLINQEVFVDGNGLQIARVTTRTMLIRFPPWLPDLDDDLRERNDGQPPLLDVLDLERAVAQLRALGMDVGPIVKDGWDGLAEIEIPGEGRFRLVGPLRPGAEFAIERVRGEPSV